MPFSPSQNLKAAGLWQKTSAAGNTYFVGRLGGVKILIFENRDRSDQNVPTHTLYFADGEAPRAETRDPVPASAPRRRSSYSPSRRSALGNGGSLPDDRLDDLWPTR
jgi:hypothetical protein